MIKLFIQGIRPKTLVAAFVPPFVAHSLYFSVTNKTEYMILTLCILLALCIQIATNFYNDAIDFIKGADDNRVGPKRITSEVGFNPKTVFLIGHTFILLAFLCGIPLVMKGGVVFLILGVVSLFLAYGYTGGPFPLAYLGLGEVFVFVFFGLIATCGSYYLFSGGIDLASIVLGSCIGLLSSVLIAINNFRDRETDVLVSKNTLATKLSKSQYLLLIDLFIFTPYLLLLFFILTINLNFFIPIFAMGFAHRARYIIRNHQEKVELNEALALSGKQLFLFGLLFSVGCIWG
jgi:1,4-dihydroxy-2-naphthoate octaprenyltransferase